MSIVHLAHPWVLALAVPVWAGIAAAVLSARARRPGFVGRAALGCLATGLLLAALAGPSVQIGRRGSAGLALAYDASAGMALARAAPADRLAADITRATGRADLAVVTFASRAATGPTASRDDLGPDGSNLAAGLERTAASLPDGQGIVLLYTDARETLGDARQAAARLAARGIQVHALVPALEAVADVRLAGLEPLAQAEPGRPVAIQVRVAASAAARGSLFLTRQEVEGHPPAVQERRLDLEAGLGATVLFEDTPPDVPAVVYVAEVVAAPDRTRQNNWAALTVPVGPPRLILYVHGAPEPGPALEWLRHAGGAVRAAPAHEGLAIYTEAAVVVLDNVSAWTGLGEAAARRLAARVTDGGLGLLVLGGDASFSSGGYGDSAIEEVLPVTSRAARRRPLHMVFVLDASGSMNETVGGIRKMTLAKQAVLGLRPVLAEADQVAIVAFAGEPRTVSPLRPLGAWDAMRQALLALEAGGGTRITPALREALRLLPEPKPDEPAARRLLLLSDGRSEDFQVERLVPACRAAETSVSVVATGEDADRERLARLAEETGGRLYIGADLARLAETFIRDLAEARGEGLRPGPVPARWVQTTPFWERAGPALPDATGYNPTRAKEGAAVHWAVRDPAGSAGLRPGEALSPPGEAGPRPGEALSPLGEAGPPLLASWRRGLGVAAAMPWPVSEAPPPWQATDALPRYLPEIVAALTGPALAPAWTARLLERDGRRIVRVEQPAEAIGTPGAAFQAAVFAAAGAEALTKHLVQTAPGVFEGDLGPLSPESAAVVVHGTGAAGGRQTLTAAGLGPKEFEHFGLDRERLEEIVRAGGGRLHESIEPLAEALVRLEVRRMERVDRFLVWAAAAAAALLVVLRLAGRL